MPSKKRSAAKPPEDAVFFIDRSLGVEPVRTALRKAGLRVEIHDDHFPRDTPDELWLATAGERRWIVLTKDQRLRYRPLEVAALRASQSRVFVLVAGNLRGSQIADEFLAAMPRIFAALRRHPGPFIARITRGGRVTID